MINFISNIVEN